MLVAEFYRYYIPAAVSFGIFSFLLLLWWHPSNFMTNVQEHAYLLDVCNIPPRRWIYNSIFALVLAVTVVWYWVPSFRTKRMHHRTVSQYTTSNLNQSSIQIITINTINWNVVQYALKSYRTETNAALEHLSMTLEVVISEENQHGCESRSSDWKLSNHIRRKILRLSELYDQDMEILENELLVPFPTIQALPHTMVAAVSSVTQETNDADKTETNFTWWSDKSNQTFTNKVETYDSIRQVVAHIVRDWSSTEGAQNRDALYLWCVQQLRYYQYVPSNGPVLVPGAGLGRLAWDISRNLHCTVEAIESSVCMTAAAYSILNVHRKNTFVLHPFAADSFSNEIDDEARYDAIYFPDVNPAMGVGTVSYTVGTFGFEKMQHCSNQYGAVVTSFFIDTATTVYDFITTVAMVITYGGLWINVGPLQWHINNKVPVSVNELRLILENFRDHRTGKLVFRILHWSVDEIPIRYRNHGGRHRSTYYDGYCPLRFVMRKISNEI